MSFGGLPGSEKRPPWLSVLHTPPPLLLGEPWKSPKPTSDGPDLSLSFFCPLDYNQLLRVSPQMPPPEFPKGRKLSKLQFKQAGSARGEGARHGWQARGRAAFPLPTPTHLEEEATRGGGTPTLSTGSCFGTISDPHPCMSLEPLQRGLGDSSDRPTQSHQPQES